MKTFSTIIFIVLLALIARGQGTVTFANTPTTTISTNNFYFNGVMSGAGNYSFGLYLAPFGNSPSMLVATTTNGPFPGLFNGGSVAPVGFGVGSQVFFQVRGWSIYAGSSYEQALQNALNGGTAILLGESSLGFFTVPASGSVPIFGTGPGQVGGFTLAPLVPEPSAFILGLMGFLFLGWRRWMPRRSSRKP